MATNTTPTPTPAVTPKVQTVLDDMPARVIRDTHEEAIAYITECAKKYSDFGNHSIISPIDAKRNVEGFSQDAEGNLVFDPELFPAEMRVMIAVLTQRGEGKGNSSVKAIVVSPVPSLDSILADTQGQAWIQKIVGTELNRVAVRALRPEDANIKDPTVLDSLPKSLADYVTSNRGGSSTLLEAFEEFWKPIKQALGTLSKSFKLANLSKREFRYGMSSKAYAGQYYPTLEETKKGSLFVFAIQAFQAEGRKAGKDVSIFDQWLANRDTTTIEESDEDETDEISLDALMGAISAPAAAPAGTDAPATESEPEPAPVTQPETPPAE